jgi:hypothetical protein
MDVLAFHDRGRRISIVLNRKRYKRCDFLFLTKKYKNRPGEQYEQIFWLTRKSINEHRPAFKLISHSAAAAYTVRIDSNERYPWRFTGAETEQASLPVGDYALVRKRKIMAVVERKTMDNMLADFGKMPVLHQQLAELALYRHHALVIENPYTDFLNPKKVHHFTPSFCAKALGELHVLHPRLKVIYCANRKSANEWARNYFAAVWNLADIKQHEEYKKQIKPISDSSKAGRIGGGRSVNGVTTADLL